MPNWYTTRVEVTGPKKAVASFKAKHIGGPDGFDFNTVIPMPDVYNHINAASDVKAIAEKLQGPTLEVWQTIAKHYGEPELAMARMSLKARAEHGHGDWYEWCNENWGTKWNASNFALDEGPTHLSFTFDTAWGPPEPVLCKLVDMYPKLKFKVYGHGEEDREDDWTILL